MFSPQLAAQSCSSHSPVVRMEAVSVTKIVAVVLLLLSCLTEAGIMGLSKYMRSTFRKAWVSDVRSVGTLHVDHLCIDMNQVLHGCFRSTRNPDHIMAKIFLKLDHIFTIAKPIKSLVLAFDGPAPYAKIQTQRDRRREHPESCLITPGTSFMNSVESIMLCYCLQRYHRHHLGNTAVFISDGTCPGEGELKIIEWVRRHLPQGVGDPAAAPTKDTVLICGSDSDILVQSLCLGDMCPNTAVLQMSTEGPDAVCNITMLRAGIVEATGVKWGELDATKWNKRHSHMNQTWLRNNTEEAALEQATMSVEGVASNGSRDAMNEIARLRSLQLDLVVLFALQGNDYLPKMRSMSFSRALAAYGRAMNALPAAQRYLVDLTAGTFNFRALWALFREIEDATHLMPVPLPVAVPDPLAALSVALQRKDSCPEGRRDAPSGGSATGSTTTDMVWEEALVEAGSIRALSTTSSDTQREFFALERQAGGSRRVVYYQDEAHVAQPVSLEGLDRGLRLWHASLTVGGRHYASLRLSATKRGARRHLAELVLRDIDADAYKRYVTAADAAHQALAQMRRRAVESPLVTADLDEKLERVYVGSDEAGADGSILPLGLEGETNAGLIEDDAEVTAEDEAINDDDSGVAGDERVATIDVVSSEEYLRYLGSGDVRQFLNGVLWMVHMYARGECPDQAYTYSGGPPITALAVMRYIEQVSQERPRNSTEGARALDSNQNRTHARAGKASVGREVGAAQRHLAGQVRVPKSAQPSLSAEATGLCVLPEEGVAFLPPELR